jgi:fermentation-respiration switch protein FrsA (DUF1100 family)
LLLAIVSVLGGAYLGVGAFITLTTTHPHRHLNPAVSPAAQGLAFENVNFASRGGDVNLAGWFIPNQAAPGAGTPPARRAVVIVHGKDSNRTREYGGHAPEVAAGLKQRDMAVLLIDLRGHGTSGDARFTLGIKESFDVLGAVDFLRARGYPAGSIGLLGQSMGAAATIYAAAAEPAIGAVISDCGFSDIGPVMAREWRHTTGLPNVFLPATRLWSFLIMGVDLAAVRPVSVIGQIAPRPVLLIHGGADALVPVEQVHALHSALPSAELWIIPGASHVGGYRQEPAEYMHRVGDFFDHHLPR